MLDIFIDFKKINLINKLVFLSFFRDHFRRRGRSRRTCSLGSLARRPGLCMAAFGLYNKGPGLVAAHVSTHRL